MNLRFKNHLRLAILLGILGTACGLGACSSDNNTGTTSEEDSGAPPAKDAGKDSKAGDATSSTDSGGGTDSGKKDTGTPPDEDAGDQDAGDQDTGTVTEGGTADTSVGETGASDTGAVETGSSDTGAAETGSSDTGAPDAGCNAVGFLGTEHAPTTVGGSVPTMSGGTLTDGTYVLTAVNEYNGGTATVTSHGETAVVSNAANVGTTGATMQFQVRNSGVVTRLNATLTTVSASGTYIVTFTCGNTGAVSGTYRVTGTGFERLQAGEPNEVFVYTKQP